MVATARCELSAALFAHQSRTGARPLKDEVDAAVLVVQGAAPFEVLSGPARWRLAASCRPVAALRPAAGLLVVPAALAGRPACCLRSRTVGPLPSLYDPASHARFPHTALLFAAALASGWPWSLALYLFAGVSLGSYCNCGFGFITSHGLKLAQESLRDGRWLVGHVHDQGRAGAPVSVLFDGSAVVFVQSSKSLRVRRPSAHPDRAVVAAQRRTRDYVRLPVDSDGNLVLPELLVTSIVERRLVWARLIQMDGVTRSLVNGKLEYRRISSLVTASWLPLLGGPKCQGCAGTEARHPVLSRALEYVPPGAPPPTVVEPKPAGVAQRYVSEQAQHYAVERRASRRLAEMRDRPPRQAPINLHPIVGLVACAAAVSRPAANVKPPNELDKASAALRALRVPRLGPVALLAPPPLPQHCSQHHRSGSPGSACQSRRDPTPPRQSPSLSIRTAPDRSSRSQSRPSSRRAHPCTH